jgi:hypothetical protein
MKQDKVNRVKHLILAITNAADFEALRNHPSFTSDELNWLRRNVLTSEQRATFTAAVINAQNNVVEFNVNPVTHGNNYCFTFYDGLAILEVLGNILSNLIDAVFAQTRAFNLA